MLIFRIVGYSSIKLCTIASFKLKLLSIRKTTPNHVCLCIALYIYKILCFDFHTHHIPLIMNLSNNFQGQQPVGASTFKEKI